MIYNKWHKRWYCIGGGRLLDMLLDLMIECEGLGHRRMVQIIRKGHQMGGGSMQVPYPSIPLSNENPDHLTKISISN